MTKWTKQVAVRKYNVVTLDHLWPDDKLATITEMAQRNGLELADMVDQILDDWAAMANREIGNDVPRVLEHPLERKPRQGESA